MKAYQELSKEELLTLKAELNAAYEDAKGKGLKLDMSRGKPAVNQLDMTMDYLDVVNSQSAMKAEDGMDVRNYGGLDGIPEAKKLIADILEVKPENVILRGSEAVLIDFDAARIYKDESEGDTQILGTTGFAAPEQYGISQSDERADIYSLGVLLNIMLTGKHPSRGLADGRMGRIVQKCTMTAPEKRYQSAKALLEAL